MKASWTVVLVALVALAYPRAVFADVATPLTLLTLPLFPVIVAVETLILFLWLTKRLRVSVGILRSILTVLAANLVTSLIGTFIPTYRQFEGNLVALGVAFVLSVFIEWAVYIPFFLKISVRRRDLLKISILANLVSYGILAALFAIGIARHEERNVPPPPPPVHGPAALLESHPVR